MLRTSLESAADRIHEGTQECEANEWYAKAWTEGACKRGGCANTNLRPE